MKVFPALLCRSALRGVSDLKIHVSMKPYTLLLGFLPKKNDRAMPFRLLQNKEQPWERT